MIFAIALCFVFVGSSMSFVLQPWAGNSGCNNPKYWCKNQETAQECGVLEYCKIEWGKTQTTDFIFNKKTPKINALKLDASPVKVTLYYESLCPDCKQFIQAQWFPTYQKLAKTGILDLELIPYGNAREYQYGSKWIFYCQHGSAECLGNLIETCAISITGKLSIYAPFVHCLEYYGPTVTNAKYCASVNNITYASIDKCINSEQGNNLEHQMALKTQALNPPHKYVPWVTVNGEHTDQIQSAIQSNMLAYVCSIYQGTKPAACSSTERKFKNVCYRD